MLEVLRSDFSRIPELLGRAVGPPPEQVAVLAATPEPQPVQLGLF
jgi:hypothetical protein